MPAGDSFAARGALAKTAILHYVGDRRFCVAANDAASKQA
jgi:hypothetical protein